MLSIKLDRRPPRSVLRAHGRVTAAEAAEAIEDALCLVPASDDLVIDVSALELLSAVETERLMADLVTRSEHVDAMIITRVAGDHPTGA